MKMKINTYEMNHCPKFKISYYHGDEWWKRQIWIEHLWFGKYYWHLIFLK